MATQQPPVDRLKAQLLNSGLQQKDFPLYQVINGLIDALRQTIEVTGSSIEAIIEGNGGGGTTEETIVNQFLFPIDGQDGDEGPIGPPGPIGVRGPIGPIGPPGIDGNDSEDFFEPVEPGLPFVLQEVYIAGNIDMIGGTRLIRTNATNKYLYILGGTTINNGSSLQFYGETQASFPGDIYLVSGGNTANPNSIIELAYRDSGGYHPLVTLSKDGELRVRQTIRFSGSITPAQITADQNDYAPAGHATASVFRLSSDAARSITGLAGGVDGRMIHLQNVGSFQIDFAAESASSAAANRFASALIVPAANCAMAIYDGTASRWRIM